jgi:hypothetical protein
MQTVWHNFAGLNIKGTPAMSARKVRHDLRVAKNYASVVVLQEFRWPWYWRVATRVMGRVKKWRNRWASSPSYRDGLARPVFGAQAVMWRRKVWKRLDTMQRILHRGAAGISEDRRLRACLLADRETGLAAWFGTTHFVVGGDNDGDGRKRRAMLQEDIRRLDKFLTDLTADGEPVVFQLDANIRAKSDTYRQFREMLARHKAILHGNKSGVEYLFTINGKKVRVDVKKAWQIPVTALRTDHEGRGITFRLVSTA